MKSSASVRRAVGPDPAAMGFDDRSTDRKAKAHAVGLAAHKGFEKLGRDLLGYAWARVRHGHLNHCLRPPPRRDREVANGDLRHRLDRSEEHTSELQSLMRISYA